MTVAEYGYLQMNIEALLRQKSISKNQICKDLDIPRTNFNRYCKGDFQRLDASLLCKLCFYLETDMNAILTYHRPEEKDGDPLSTENGSGGHAKKNMPEN